jgi:predicted MFS family arabinose efflux permease
VVACGGRNPRGRWCGGLLIPRLSGLAALGLVGVLTGAAVTNLVILQESPIVPMVLLALAAFIAWGRREGIRFWVNRRRRAHHNVTVSPV